MARRPIHDLLDRLVGAEDRFLQSEFLAPAQAGGVVEVRIAGVVCRLRLAADFRGWGVFRATAAGTATPIRRATLAERRRYLDLFPRLRVILCRPLGGRWLAWPAHRGDRRFGPRAPLTVRLVEEAQPFDLAETRFDGEQAWFARPDARADPAAAAYLRQALNAITPPQEVHRRGLSPEEHAAYGMMFTLRRADTTDRAEDRLRGALAHAGAQLAGYAERDDAYRVEYTVDGERHVSLVDKSDLSVRLAGICLSGEDRRFDLHSLVGVLRQARRGRVPRVGGDNGGMAEGHYWQVHPRR